MLWELFEVVASVMEALGEVIIEFVTRPPASTKSVSINTNHVGAGALTRPAAERRNNAAQGVGPG